MTRATDRRVNCVEVIDVAVMPVLATVSLAVREVTATTLVTRRRVGPIAVVTLALGILAGAVTPALAQKEIVVGLACDAGAATQVAGSALCPGFKDYTALVNSKGGVDGVTIRADAVDHASVAAGIEAYERLKKAGAVAISVYGAPLIYPLIPRLADDKIPGTSPGFATAITADGRRAPFVFPIAATSWSQAGAAVQFVKDRLRGNLQGVKVAYVFSDNPPGREPIPVLEDLAERERFALATYPVPPSSIELGTQARDIVQRYHAGFVFSNLSEPAASAANDALKFLGYSLSNVLGFAGSSAEADVLATSDWALAEGYHTMQVAGVGQDFPVIREIREMYAKQGKEPPKAMASSVYYNRGILDAAVLVQAIHNALTATKGRPITGDDVRKGLEQIKGVPTVGALAPPLAITAENHEGGGWVSVYQVRGGTFVKEKDWFRANRDVVDKHLKAAAGKPS